MKKIIYALLSPLLFLGLVNVVSAEINSITPSTNDINRTNGWAHVNQIDVDTESVTLEFVSTRAFASCFEYRTDGDTSEAYAGYDNYNSSVTDGLYPFYCLNNNGRTERIEADEYIEVRMVFGAEGDERFDWTRFDVAFERFAEINSPGESEVVSGIVSFDATLNDKDGDDSVQWAVRKGTCQAGVGTVLGNVDGRHDLYDWDGYMFHAEANTLDWEDGAYCFIFNPTESAGDTGIRETQEFVVNNTPDNMNECKEGGWQTFYAPEFKNQGDCVSFLQSNENAKENQNKNQDRKRNND